MKKVDYKKEYKTLYQPSPKQPVIVDVPEFQFLMIDGLGAPGESKTYQEALEALYGVSYKMKFHCKLEKDFDFTVMPLEGLWWADDMNDFVEGNRDNWKWTLMIMQPSIVTEAVFQWALAEVAKKKELPALPLLELKLFKEGKAAQMMHIGPYADEHPNIMKIHETIKESGGKLDSPFQKHHEIYLSDPRKTAPEKLKTVLRQPFTPHDKLLHGAYKP